MIAISVVKKNSDNVCFYNSALQILCKHLQSSRSPDKPWFCLTDTDIAIVEGLCLS